MTGFAAGLVSPVTDLFGLPAFVDAVDDFVKKTAMSIVGHAPDLATEGGKIAAQFRKLKAEMKTALVEILIEQAKDPSYLFKMVETAGDTALQMAGRVGHGAAAEAIHLFESPWEEEKDKDLGWKSVLPKDTTAAAFNPMGAGLATASRVWEYGTETAKKKIFSAGWSKVGYAIGHVVGAVVANVLLLVFTEGIGNAIAAIGEAASKLAPALRAFGSVATKIAEALKVVGGAIKGVEEGIAVIAKTVLKPLGRVLKPFGELLEELQKWLRKLFGVAEKEGAEVAAAAGGKFAGKLEEEVQKEAPKLSTPSSKAEPHVPGETTAADDMAAMAPPKKALVAKSTPPDVAPTSTIEPKPKEGSSIPGETGVGSKSPAKGVPPVHATDDRLVVVKIQGSNKGQYWQEGTPQFKANAGTPKSPPNEKYVVLPKSQANDLGFRLSGTAPKVTIEPRIVGGKPAESLGAGRRFAGPEPRSKAPTHPITARTTRKPPPKGRADPRSLESATSDPSAQHAFPRTIGADVMQAQGYNKLLDGNELGILRPGNVSTGGVDAITARVEGGKAKIFLNDFTTPGTPKAPKAAHAKWLKELEAAAAGDRLSFGNKAIEDAVHQAIKDGDIFVRTVRVDIPAVATAGGAGEAVVVLGAPERL
ncbi:MAG: hypothetical protein ABI988_07330 [Nitrospirota bacterium]